MEAEFAEPVRQSFALWFFSALGWRYALLLPLTGLLAFVLILVLLIRGRSWATGAAIVLLAPLPLLVGLLGTIDGAILSHMVIASSDVTPKPSAVAEGISTSLITALVGLLLMVPNYILAVVGLLIRALQAETPK